MNNVLPIIIAAVVLSSPNSWGEAAAAAAESGRGETCANGETCTSVQHHLEAFEDWLGEQSLPVNKLKVANIPGFGRGTLATESLEQGSLYVSVPEHLLIGPEKIAPGTVLYDSLARARTRFPNGTDAFNELADQKAMLLMFLLREKHVTQNSIWKTYIDALPSTVTVPALFSASELVELQASQVVPAAAKLKRQMRQQYDDLREHVFAKDRDVFPKKAFSLKEWQWAFIIYDSRVIQLNRNTGRGNTPTFIPLIDMVNCKESSDKTFIVFNEKTQTADMYADVDFAVGEQVFETYGNKSNYEYLLYNGFVMKDNPNECVHVALTLDWFPTSNPTRVCLDPNASDLPQGVKVWGTRMEQKKGGAGHDHLATFLDEAILSYGTDIVHDEMLLEKIGSKEIQASEHYRWAVMQRLHEKKSIVKARKRLRLGEWKCCKRYG